MSARAREPSDTASLASLRAAHQAPAGSPAAASAGFPSLAARVQEWPAWVAGEGATREEAHLRSGRAFLEAMPQGAYTTTRTVARGARVLLWEFHAARALDSLQRLLRACPDLFPAALATATPCPAGEPGQEPDALLGAPSVGPAASAALAQWLPHLRDEVRQCLSLAWGSMLASEAWRSLRASEGGLSGAPPPEEPNIAFTVLICGRAPPLPRAGGAPPAIDGPLPGACPFSVFVHASAFAGPALGSGPSAAAPPGSAAAVMGPPRTVPLAKFSGWPLLRRFLEQRKPAGTREILLSPDGSRLLEGVVTNFLVVRRAAPGGARGGQGGSGTGLWDGAEVVTAPLEGLGVLPGSIRSILLEQCRLRGARVVLEAPRLEERDTWQEAFVTNAMWLLEPISTIRFPTTWPAGPPDSWWDPHGTAWQTWDLPQGHQSAYYHCLMEWLLEALDTSSYSLDDLQRQKDQQGGADGWFERRSQEGHAAAHTSRMYK